MKTNTKHWASITAGILSIASYAIASPLGSEKYTYDASGNIIEKLIDENVTRISYGSDNRMTKRQVIGQSSETIDHNAAGHPVSEQNASTHQVCSTIYGYEYKVLETQKQGMKANFYYNSDGRLDVAPPEVCNLVVVVVPPRLWLCLGRPCLCRGLVFLGANPPPV